MASSSRLTLSSLLSSSSITDHEEVLNAVNGILKTSSNSQDGLRIRVVALIKLDRFDDALRAIDGGGHNLAQQCTLEKVYALYKVGKLEEAARIVEGADGPGSRGLQHVAAQLAYRAERFEDAARIYKALSAQDSVIEGEANDLRINSSATDAQLEWQDNGDKVDFTRKKPGIDDLEAFETTYNAACGCIARGDFDAGCVLLKRARDLCEALDELTDEEKKAEILPIMVQQVYVFIRMGKQNEANALLGKFDIVEYVYKHIYDDLANCAQCFRGFNEGCRSEQCHCSNDPP
jgi:signal recognition particle subunit SRP72